MFPAVTGSPKRNRRSPASSPRPGADRMHSGGAADGVRSDFRKSYVTHVTRLHHVGERSDSVFDGHVGIESRRPVDVDVVDAETSQRIGKFTAMGRAS